MSDFNSKTAVAIKYAEASFIVVAFIAVGYLLHSEDPCFLSSKINISLFILAILTLFFGWAGLFSFMAIYGFSLALFYTEFHLYQMLQLIVLGLILYLFYYIWETKIKKQAVKEEYLNQKLDENTNAFYTLKASYDQLEKAYITKPFSLKDSLQKIIDIAKRDRKSAKEEFLKLLYELYQVKKSLIIFYEYENHKVYPLESYNDFDDNDPLVKRAIKENQTVYIDLDTNNKESQYLSVIPIRVDERVSFLLVIEDMLFTSFNADSLLQISVISTYFIQSLEKQRFIKEYQCSRPYLSEDFAFELCKLQQIQKLYKIPSSVVSLKSTNYEYMKKLHFIIQKEKRAIDKIQTLTINKKDYVIIILFPFANISSVEGFLSRLKTALRQNIDLLEHIKSKDFVYKIGDIRQNRLENLLR